MLDNTPNQPTEFRAKNWVEINDESRGRYNTKGKIKFKTSMIRSSLCDYSDVYLLVKESILIEIVAKPAPEGNDGKEVVFKSCVPFIDCISEINKTQIDNARYIDTNYSLIEYSDNYSKTLGSLWQYYRDGTALTAAGAIKTFHVGDNNSASFKFKQKVTGVTAANGRKNVEIMVPLMYLRNF